MSSQSRYSTTEFESVMQDVLEVLNKHKVKNDLSLMVLGNIVSTIIKENIAKDAREIMVEKFCTALKSSTLE